MPAPRAHVETRGAGTHGDVLNVHTETFWMDTRGAGGHRQFCLPKFAHVGLSRALEVHQRNPWIFPISKFENRLRNNMSPIPPIIRFNW